MPAVLADFASSVHDFWQKYQNASWVHWSEGFLFFVGIVLGAGLLRRYLRKELQRTRLDLQVTILVTRLVYLGGLLLAVITFFSVALQNVALVFGSFGVFALAFGLAFQDILKNFIAGVFLLIERPFRIGDEITADTHTGKVENIQMRTTTLRTQDGEQVLIPNSLVYTSTIVNRSRFPARQFTVTAKLGETIALDGLTQKIEQQVKSTPGVAAEPPPQVGVQPNIDGGVTLEVRYWLDYRKYDPLAVQGQVSERLYQAIRQSPGASKPAS
jgi:small-conductance mechanosensitive channel